MRRSVKKFNLAIAAALLILSAAIFACAQEDANSSSRRNARATDTPRVPVSSETLEAVRYSYEFSKPEFQVRHIVVEHDAAGRGRVTFERGDVTEPVSESLELSPATLQRVATLWSELHFLDSNASYQSSRQYAHLGTMRISMRRGAQERTAEFNWTDDRNAFALVGEYRRIADQAILVFDLKLAQENQPLAAPRLLDQLDRMLDRNALSDPRQLTPLLTDLSTDERLPLIARNHATRLIRKISR